MGFTKLDQGIIKSSIMAEDSDVFKVWITMLACCGPDGVADVSAPALVGICHLSMETVEKSLNKLCDPDPDSRSTADQGRRLKRVDGGYFIVNYAKYRNFAYSETSGAIRTRRWREKKKRHGGVTSVTAMSHPAIAKDHGKITASRKSDVPPPLGRHERHSNVTGVTVTSRSASASRGEQTITDSKIREREGIEEEREGIQGIHGDADDPELENLRKLVIESRKEDAKVDEELKARDKEMSPHTIRKAVEKEFQAGYVITEKLPGKGGPILIKSK